VPASKIELGLEFRNQRFRDARAGLSALGRQFTIAFGNLDPIIQRELKDMLDTVARAMAERHNVSWTPGVTLPEGERRGLMARRSGAMLRGIKRSVKVEGKGLDDIRGTISGPAIHEFGGKIRAKRAQYLTIPLKSALDAKGVPIKRRARDWTNTFVQKSKRGNLIIFKKGFGGSLIPLYVLKREVTIPPRLGLGVTLDVAVPPFQDRLFDKLLKKILKDIDGGAL